MTTNRLFITGDSFVDWAVPKNHWTYYLSKHFEVHKYGKYGADNQSIIFQLGELPEYKNGDRLIMLFSEPGRLPRRYYGDRKPDFDQTPYMSPDFYNDNDFANKLHLLRYKESERWVNGERELEVKFLKNLKMWLSSYNPVFVTWSESFHSRVKDFVHLFKVTSNYEEGIGDSRDFHPGIKGCYDLYIILHKLLGIDDKPFPFENEMKSLL